MRRWLIFVYLLVVSALIGLNGGGILGNQSQNLYRDPIDEKIKAGLKKMWSKAKSGYLLDSYDKKCFQNGQEDIRVLKTLDQLCGQKKHLLAIRVKSGYDDAHATSRESAPGWNNVSAHNTAQAFDIFFADKVEIAWQVSNDPVKRKKAQDKIRQILKEVLEIGRLNSNLLPTQIFVYNQQDIMAFQKEAKMLYGGYPPDTGLRGMMVGPRYWDRIHIGY